MLRLSSGCRHDAFDAWELEYTLNRYWMFDSQSNSRVEVHDAISRSYFNFFEVLT